MPLLRQEVTPYYQNNSVICQGDEFAQMELKSIRTQGKLAKSREQGAALGLTTEEMAFYDALTRPEAIKDFYQNEELIAMTRELTEMLRKNRTVDWQKKEMARASMRKMVKRLLKKYKYPPEGVEDAVNTVINQCELWTDN